MDADEQFASRHRRMAHRSRDTVTLRTDVPAVCVSVWGDPAAVIGFIKSLGSRSQVTPRPENSEFGGAAISEIQFVFVS
jgi:hypothetical protein